MAKNSKLQKKTHTRHRAKKGAFCPSCRSRMKIGAKKCSRCPR